MYRVDVGCHNSSVVHVESAAICSNTHSAAFSERRELLVSLHSALLQCRVRHVNYYNEDHMRAMVSLGDGLVRYARCLWLHDKKKTKKIKIDMNMSNNYVVQTYENGSCLCHIT